MNNYLKPDVVSRAQALGLKARLLVEGLRVGDHKSPYRGFSVEFVQHREYVPGDDIRHIDWKGYGRSRTLHDQAVRAGNELHRPCHAR